RDRWHTEIGLHRRSRGYGQPIQDRRSKKEKGTMKVALQWVQTWIDRRSGGVRVRHYFRRPGFQRIALPGLPGSAEFNRAYEAALSGERVAPIPLGAELRSGFGSIAATIAEYYDSQQFFAM